ncbi:succinate dehydrogenase assembly factor 2 [Litorivivens sp.]|uniref:FAD assembly factor SdhE n=1 Tax=Litorivivens sp. TaxID=2020868 RepID=UPI00356AF0F1
MYSENEIKRIYWASRRGMLELDLMLVPFMENCFRELGPEKQRHYVELMECEDTQIFQWLLGTESPAEENLLGIVNDIKAYARRAKG